MEWVYYRISHWHIYLDMCFYKHYCMSLYVLQTNYKYASSNPEPNKNNLSRHVKLMLLNPHNEDANHHKIAILRIIEYVFMYNRHHTNWRRQIFISIPYKERINSDNNKNFSFELFFRRRKLQYNLIVAGVPLYPRAQTKTKALFIEHTVWFIKYIYKNRSDMR
jgi:hypothetical protein